MSIYAIYKHVDMYKLILDVDNVKFEINICKKFDSINIKGYYNVTIGMDSLIKDNDTKLNTNIEKVFMLVKEFITNSYTEELPIKFSLFTRKEVTRDLEDLVSAFDNVGISTKVKEDGFEQIHKQEYSNENFLNEFETKDLRMKRYYNKQRKDVLSWDEYFMALARLTALRSKDPSTQVGACIVDSDKRILSVGYNGSPLGIEDDIFPWDRDGDNIHTKYMYVCHAEMNAIMNYRGSRKDLEGSTVYVDLFPCNECAKMIIQAGIKRVVYLSDKYNNTEGNIASKRLLDLAGVEYMPLETAKKEVITLSLNHKDK